MQHIHPADDKPRLRRVVGQLVHLYILPHVLRLCEQFHIKRLHHAHRRINRLHRPANHLDRNRRLDLDEKLLPLRHRL